MMYYHFRKLLDRVLCDFVQEFCICVRERCQPRLFFSSDLLVGLLVMTMLVQGCGLIMFWDNLCKIEIICYLSI